MNPILEVFTFKKMLRVGTQAERWVWHVVYVDWYVTFWVLNKYAF